MVQKEYTNFMLLYIFTDIIKHDYAKYICTYTYIASQAESIELCLSVHLSWCLSGYVNTQINAIIKARDTKFDLKVVCDAHRPRKSNNFLKSILSEVLKKQLSDFDMYYTFPPLNYNPTGQ